MNRQSTNTSGCYLIEAVLLLLFIAIAAILSLRALGAPGDVAFNSASAYVGGGSDGGAGVPASLNNQDTGKPEGYAAPRDHSAPPNANGPWGGDQNRGF